MSLTDGLVGAWLPSLGPTAGVLLDRSAYSNHGTLTNMDPATDWQASGSGWSLDFDRVNDYVPCGNRINASLANHLTLAMWARFDQVGRKNGLMSTIAVYGAGGQQLEFGRQAGKFSWLQNGGLDAIATNAVASGEHFIAFTRTGTTGNWTLTFWIDDQPADEHTTSVNQRSDGGLGNFTIGRAGDLTDQYFDGALHGAAAWQRALTPAEIKSLRQAGPGDWLRRKRRRVYSIPAGPAFKAAWATRATTIAGVLQ